MNIRYIFKNQNDCYQNKNNSKFNHEELKKNKNRFDQFLPELLQNPTFDVEKKVLPLKKSCLNIILFFGK